MKLHKKQTFVEVELKRVTWAFKINCSFTRESTQTYSDKTQISESLI